jgi:cellulose synthase/poly-beta-1,6-N-acetylglucosamine synthase-like glycosyltransferase
MNQLPFVSVVVPAYQRTAMLRKAVESLFRQDYPTDRYEVLVVDSSPGDENVEMLRDFESQAPCPFRFEHKKPEGPGPSRNLGAQLSFMDSDCFAAPEWLSGGIASFTGEAGIVQGRTLPDPAGKPGIFKWYLQVEQETPLYETANIFYRRCAFESAGGFPADLNPSSYKPMGGEDVAVAWKVKRLGWLSRFAPAALVYHEVVPLSVWSWICIKHHYIFPALLKDFPELRKFMFRSYFFDKAQALFVVLALGILLGLTLHPLWLLLSVPYLAYRAMQPTKSMRGILRIARIAPYFARDVSSFVLLVAGSVRSRCLLL